MNFPIDFVVTWVDGSDPVWQKKRAKYSSNIGSNERGMSSIRAYREWGTFKFWFRAVEMYAPWVNHIYLITDNQIPKWLDDTYDKLTVVDHKEIISKKYLPTFNSNAIEANLYKIKGLSEHFVVFNDDMYITKKVHPGDFFDFNGKPKVRTCISPIVPVRYGTANFQVNDMKIINDHFNKKQIIKNANLLSFRQDISQLLRTFLYMHSKCFLGFWEEHMPYALLKSTYEELWTKETGILNQTSSNKFRNDSDTNIWLFKYWQLADGKATLSRKKIGKLFGLNKPSEVWKALRSSKYKIICINDNVECNEKEIRDTFDNLMEVKYNQKSRFEK